MFCAAPTMRREPGLRAGAVGVFILALCACHANPKAQEQTPAHMVVGKHQAQCIAQMQAATQTQDGEGVALTAAAFAHEDKLSIVPSQTVLDAAGQSGSGRLLGRPETYRLTLKNGICTMLREADAKATSLPACDCVAVRHSRK